jgi:hypothetical protein
MFGTVWSWAVPLLGAALVFAGVLLTAGTLGDQTLDALLRRRARRII